MTSYSAGEEVEVGEIMRGHFRTGWRTLRWQLRARRGGSAQAASGMKTKAPKARAYCADHHVARHGERSAEAWLKAGLRAAGIKPGELERLKGSDPRKLMLADHLWRRTVVSQEWLAGKLAMKSAANVSQQLRRLDRKRALGGLPEALKKHLGSA